MEAKLSHTTVFRWFKEFRRGQKSLLDEEYTGTPFSAEFPENALVAQKMLINDNRCAKQMI